MTKLTSDQLEKLDEILHTVFMDNCTQITHKDGTVTYRFDDEDRDNLSYDFRQMINETIGVN